MREAGLRLLAASPGEHVLEIGFGTGHILAELAKAVGPTGSVFGIDISENMLAHAMDVLSNEGLIDRVSLHCGDVESLPYSDGRMDGMPLRFLVVNAFHRLRSSTTRRGGLVRLRENGGPYGISA
jgi:demethylmenaquinone methyltransferase/2-methoxy-6-polyprenyl-1,4-benzoquinol methylase